MEKISKEYINALYGTRHMGLKKAEMELNEKLANPEPEEWIWVEGYKGTDRDMKCRGYQFEMNKVHEMEEGAKIEICEGGFHLCRDLHDVFTYYGIGSGNRFFRVRALVRKNEYEDYKTSKDSPRYPFNFSVNDKLTSKSIQFLYELTPDEICKAANYKLDGWSSEDKTLIMEHGYGKAVELRNKAALIELGYSESFAEYIMSKKKSVVALQVGSQKDLSMDMKVLLIAREIFD